MDTKKISVPLTVPEKEKTTYTKNYSAITQNSERLFLFAADQKIEHLNQDFYGPNIPKECNNPEYLFTIASKGRIGAFATHMGLIAQYGQKYKKVNYVIKLNSKTNLIPTTQSDPISLFINTPQEAIDFKNSSKLNIVGLGYTIYLGSKYEYKMLQQAEESIYQAHQHGLIALLWVYPRGRAVPEEKDAQLIAGSTGVGASLGADFIKVNPPYAETSLKSAKLLQPATQTAGKSKVICSGGKLKDEKFFLQELHEQIHIGNTSGCATGRNIFQKPFPYSIKFCDAIAAIVFDNSEVKTALEYLK